MFDASPNIANADFSPLRLHFILSILFNMKIGVAFLWTAIAISCVSATPGYSGGDFAAGWTATQEPQVFHKGHLYDYIDGGAEMYEEFGVVQLTVHQYRKAQDELELLVYEMESPEAAVGIYLMQVGTERPIAGIKARNSGSMSQISAVRGTVCIQITSFSGSPDMQSPIIDLANWALDSVPDGKPVSLFSLLPRDSLILGSERIFRGPLGLNQVLRIFNGNPLGLGGTVWGVGANYRMGKGVLETRLTVVYPNSRAARIALRHLGKAVDPSYSLASASADELNFGSEQTNRFTARIDNRRLILRHLSKHNGGK